MTFKCLNGFFLLGDLGTVGAFPARNLEESNIGADPVWFARMFKQFKTALVERIGQETPDPVMEDIYEPSINPEPSNWISQQGDGEGGPSRRK